MAIIDQNDTLMSGFFAGCPITAAYVTNRINIGEIIGVGNLMKRHGLL